ncbi:hypothetical protein ACU5CE_33445 [Priestia megaterium]|uniref:hypothetical protein n=1 Tax=Priestia megaterium TaxID=1404 RepID=UPI00406BA0C8
MDDASTHSQTEKAYWTKEVAEILKIATPTVRKYCNLMESNGYVFLRNAYNQRAFLQRDIIVLKKIQELIKQKDISVEQAIKTIVSDIPRNQLTPSITTIDNSKEDELKQIITEIEEIKRDNEQLQTTLEEFKKLMITQQEQILKQQEYIAASIEKRDNQITHLLQQSMENKKKKKLTWLQRIARISPPDIDKNS